MSYRKGGRAEFIGKTLLTVLGLENLNACDLELAGPSAAGFADGFADGLMMASSDFEDALGASEGFELRVLFATGSFAVFSAITLRFGDILVFSAS